MRPSYSVRLILLFLLLMANFIVHSQARRQDTLVLHFALNRHTPLDPLPNLAPGTKKIDSIFITGYTDKTGTLAYNQRLSAQRTAAAGEWLRAILGDLHPPANGHPLSSGHPDDSLWHLIPGGIAPTPERSDSANRRAEIVICYHPDAPPPADTTTALHRDSTQPTTVISLRHINFVVDTPIPTDATTSVLPGYVAQLRHYADRRMEIDGFCNSPVPLHGPDDPLFILSVKRAKFIYDYLVGAGFDPARLTYKGMGNASPVNADPVNREEMDANMRVEIKIF